MTDERLTEIERMIATGQVAHFWSTGSADELIAEVHRLRARVAELEQPIPRVTDTSEVPDVRGEVFKMFIDERKETTRLHNLYLSTLADLGMAHAEIARLRDLAENERALVDDGNGIVRPANVCGTGMSLLDWFAGQALAGILGNNSVINGLNIGAQQAGINQTEAAAKMAYNLAVEFVAEKRRREAPPAAPMVEWSLVQRAESESKW